MAFTTKGIWLLFTGICGILKESPRKITAKLLTPVKVTDNKAEIRKIYFDYDSFVLM
jgi:hypothetical protein